MLQRMNKKTNKYSTLEKIGVSLSFICAIHCIITPLFIAFLPMLSSTVSHNPAIEIILLGSSFLIVGIVNLIGFIKHHKTFAPLVYMLLGFSIILSGHLTHLELAEQLASIVGGVFIGLSIYANTKAKENNPKHSCCKS